MCEPFENRRLLAFSVPVITGGLLQVFADNDGVDLSVIISGDNYRITDALDGSSENVPRITVTRILLLGGVGNDRLSIASNINLDNCTVSGIQGDDTLIGGGGSDRFLGGLGVDVADYSGRTRSLRLSNDGIANDGDSDEVDNIESDVENIAGGLRGDRITGNSGANVLQGNGGNDTLVGGDGDDTLSGGNFNDELDGGAGADFLVGGAGTLDAVDYFSRTAGVSMTIDGDDNDGAQNEHDNIAATIEVFIGGTGDDLIIGSGKPNSLNGHLGNDTLRGGSGADTIFGSLGRDSILGEAGNDFLICRDGEIDTISGGSGSDAADADDDDLKTAVP